MEIEKNQQANGVRSPTTGGQQQPASNVCSGEEPRARVHQDKHAGNNNGESDGDSDSGSITCPLFMDGLPSNFATNPQLAAIASLMDGDEDDVREDAKDDDNNDTQEEKNASSQSNKYELSHQGRPPYSTQTTTPSTTRPWKPSAKTQNRRRRQRASPYPRPHDRNNDKQGTTTKSNSVREITLFMNMWKP